MCSRHASCDGNTPSSKQPRLLMDCTVRNGSTRRLIIEFPIEPGDTVTSATGRQQVLSLQALL